MNSQNRKQIPSRDNDTRVGKLRVEISVLTIALLTIALIDGLSHADENRFATEIAAVIAASNLYNPTSIVEDREYMGAVLRDGDGYLYTVSAGQQRRDKITVKIEILPGFELIALWHTHGAPASERKYFSKVDTRLAEKLQIPFYLADFTGLLKIFEPGMPRGRGKGRKVLDNSGDVIRIKVKG
jgi:hypothetical protein